jgi:uncharacterized protein YwqG
MNEQMESLAVPCIRFTKLRSDAGSYLGGTPDFGSQFEWPRRNGVPLTFLGKISLTAAQAASRIDWLPATGALYFFYDVKEQPWGFDPKDASSSVILYSADDGGHGAVKAPDDFDPDFAVPERVGLRPVSALSYPSAENALVEAMGLSEDAIDDYGEWFFDTQGGHQLAGFPSPVQNDDMEEEAFLASNGVFCGSPEGYQTDLAKSLRGREHYWQLLFQFDTDEDAGVMWGDCGTLYFFIQRNEAKSGNFNSPWAILQCS